MVSSHGPSANTFSAPADQGRARLVRLRPVDRHPADWMPPSPEAQCRYDRQWARYVKQGRELVEEES